MVGSGTSAFVRWWAERSYDRLLGLCDGSPLDEAAAVIPHATVRDPGVGVDAWNASERDVRSAAAGFEVSGGRPLRTFHFDDFDPHRPHLAAASVSRPPILLSENRALRHLHERYAASLIEAGYDDARDLPSVWTHLPGGMRLDAASRHAYRLALRAHRLGVGPEPPDPFTRDGLSAFIDLMNEPSVESGNRYSRYVWSLYQTWPGLDSVFPNVSTGDRSHFVWWLNRFARSDGPIPATIELPSRPKSSRRRGAAERGVNVAGYLQADSGLAVSAQRTIAALTSAGVAVRPVSYRRTMSRQGPDAIEVNGAELFDVNLICITAEQFPFFHADMGDSFFAGRYTIGYWYWELEVFPSDQMAALDLVDEVWVATRHVLAAIAPLTNKPVRHMPIPLVAPQPSDRNRSSFGLSDAYTFLFTFDFDSVMARKYPLGTIRAFERAFPEASSALLILKSVNAGRWPSEAELIRCAIADRPDIVLMDGYLTAADQAALVAACDCYVSLHRAEGLGLTLADAMALGKSVIATDYSGNIDFMNEHNSFPVPFTYTTVPVGTPAYPAGARWAEPDVDEAARLMKLVAEDPDVGRRIGAQARHDILSNWSVDTVGARMRDRLEEVWALHAVSRT
jgi:glycosyltransferase involved in cell wall biosynthesis